jgi:transposase
MKEGLVTARTKLVNTVRGWLRREARAMKNGSADTFAKRFRAMQARHGWEVPGYVERQLTAIEALTEQVKAAEKELKDIAERDQVCVRLMTVPGVGPQTAVRFAAALDETERFEDGHRVGSYLGLVPGERSSSEKQQRTGITKAGPGPLRWVLVQAAWSAWYWRKEDPMVEWARQVSLRRGTRVAVVALARKLAGILYAIWRDGTVYDPRRGAAPLPTA